MPHAAGWQIMREIKKIKINLCQTTKPNLKSF